MSTCNSLESFNQVSGYIWIRICERNEPITQNRCVLRNETMNGGDGFTVARRVSTRSNGFRCVSRCERRDEIWKAKVDALSLRYVDTNGLYCGAISRGTLHDISQCKTRFN